MSDIKDPNGKILCHVVHKGLCSMVVFMSENDYIGKPPCDKIVLTSNAADTLFGWTKGTVWLGNELFACMDNKYVYIYENT
jgi:hypothetical protein